MFLPCSLSITMSPSPPHCQPSGSSPSLPTVNLLPIVNHQGYLSFWLSITESLPSLPHANHSGISPTLCQSQWVPPIPSTLSITLVPSFPNLNHPGTLSSPPHCQSPWVLFLHTVNHPKSLFSSLSINLHHSPPLHTLNQYRSLYSTLSTT